MRWPDESREGETVSARPASGVSPGQADARIQAENAAAWPLAWPAFELTWRTSRWRPSPTGWTIIVIAVIFDVGLAVEAMRSLLDGSHPNALVGAMLLAASLAVCIGVAVAVLEIWPKGHQRSSCHWVMRVSPDRISLEVTERAGTPVTATMLRSEAGQLNLDFAAGNNLADSGFHVGMVTFGIVGAAIASVLAPSAALPRSVSAFNIDGRTVIALTRVSARFSWADTSSKVRPLDVLVAWWPLNHRSRTALRDYEEVRREYWHPPGVSPAATKFPADGYPSTRPVRAGSADLGPPPVPSAAPDSPLRWT
jgi:hypothetical protein